MRHRARLRRRAADRPDRAPQGRDRPRGRLIGLLTVALAAASLGAPAAEARQAAPADPTSATGQVEAIAQVFSRGVREDLRPGAHPVLIRLRRLRDPNLTPLFGAAAANDAPALAAIGILGLAELTEDGLVDLPLLARIDDENVRTSVILTALGQEMLDAGQMERVLAWPDLGAELEAILLVRLAGEGRSVAPARARALGASELPVARVIGRLLTGEHDGRTLADEFWEDASAKRDVRQLTALILAALDHGEASEAGPFLARLYELFRREPEVQSAILRRLLRADPPAGWAVWRRGWASATGVGAELRLALIAMESAEHAPAGSFDALASATHPLARSIGAAGATARTTPDPSALLEVVAHAHPVATQWAVQQASRLPEAEASRVYIGVLEQARARELGDRLTIGAAFRRAAQQLAERRPDRLASWIEGALDDELLISAALAGPLDSTARIVLWPAGSEPAWPDRRSEALATMLRAKARLGADDDDPPLTDLISEVALGWGGLDEPLRAEAAWLALRRQGQADAGLTRVLHVLRDAEG